MNLLTPFRDNWFELLQTFGIVSGFLLAAMSAREEAKQRRISNRWEVIRQHQNIWALRLSLPGLRRIEETAVDLARKPVTREETLFVRMLILNLSASFRAAKAGMFSLPDEIGTDIKTFFARPIPKAVWERLRRFHDHDFVRFVEMHRGQ